jgi:hypothetical protein
MISRVHTNNTRDYPNATWLSQTPINFVPCGINLARPVGV